MKLYFSINDGPFVHPYEFDAGSTDADAALERLLAAAKRDPRDCLLGHADGAVRRVISPGKRKPTQGELDWLCASNRRFDPERPESAIYDEAFG